MTPASSGPSVRAAAWPLVLQALGGQPTANGRDTRRAYIAVLRMDDHCVNEPISATRGTPARLAPVTPPRIPTRDDRVNPPGRPFREAPPGTGSGVNFSLFSGELRIGRAVPVRSVGQERDAHPHPREHQRRLARLLCPTSARTALRLPRVRSVRSAHGAALQSQQAAARSVCEGHRPGAAMGGRAVRLPGGRSGRRPRRSTSATARRSPRWAP